MPTSNANQRSRSKRRTTRIAYIILLLCMVVGVYGLAPRLTQFAGSLDVLSDVNKRLAFAALICSLATYWAAAGVYCSLAIKRLRYTQTGIVQFAAMFINRILPAGSGALGVNAAYLHKNRHTFAQAAAIVSLNNMLGFFGHITLLLFALFVIGGVNLTNSSVTMHTVFIVALVLALVLAVLTIVLQAFSFIQFKKWLRAYWGTIQGYRKRKAALFAAFVWSILLSMANVLCLWLSAHAVNVDLSLSGALVCLTLGVAAGTVIPTPGGIGAVEGGVYAGLILQHASPAAGFATALLFRLVNYWLPLLPGVMALVYVQQRNLLKLRA